MLRNLNFWVVGSIPFPVTKLREDQNAEEGVGPGTSAYSATRSRDNRFLSGSRACHGVFFPM